MDKELVKGKELEELAAGNPMAEIKEGEAKVEPLRVSWGLTNGGRASNPSESLRMRRSPVEPE